MFGTLKNIIMWALTYRCNMSCDYCFLRNNVKNWGELSDDECIKTAEFIAGDKTWRPDAVWLTGGEPTVRASLPDIIKILERSGIKCVVTSNGLCSENTLNNILSAAPGGINISLESVDDEKNNKFRGYTQNVVASIKKIAKQKSSDTILGVSCVVSQDNIDGLFEFAEELKAVGVEYLSINPLIGNPREYNSEEINRLMDSCKRISNEIGIKLPGDYYFHLLKCHLEHNMPMLKCPTGDHYFFISPWGGCYPCSNEIWQEDMPSEAMILKCENIKNVLSKIQEQYHTDMLTTCSSCFGDRCIGCWKLYYDTIYT